MKPWAKQFYSSAAWLHTREAYMTKRLGLCERCGRPGKIVHHRKYLRAEDMNNLDKLLGEWNLELLCQACHNEEHMRLETACAFDEDGNILPPIRDRRRGRS